MKYNGYELFKDSITSFDEAKKEYIDSINSFIEKKFIENDKKRQQFMTPESLKSNPEYFRKEYLKMIGYPFDLDSKEAPQYEKSFIGEDAFGKYYRLSIEVIPDFKCYCILEIPHNHSKKLPLVIAQHGGGGTPEWCSDMIRENNYNFFTKRALERGFAVLCPCLALWRFGKNVGESFPSFTVPAPRGEFDKRLKQLGYSITGLEVFCIKRAIDLMCSLDYIDDKKIGMMGLSYGGYFSMHTAAADTRIKSIYNAASFGDRSKSSFSDWSYSNSSHLFHDAEVAALCAPRFLWIDVGKDDAVFDYKSAIPEAEKINKFYEIHNAGDKFTFNLWEGGHRFDEDLSGFEAFFGSI